MTFSVIGVALMGVDLLITRSVFVHVAELMATSIGCLLTGLLLDGSPKKPTG